MLVQDHRTDSDQDQATRDLRTLAGDGAEYAAEHHPGRHRDERSQADRGGDDTDIHREECQSDANRHGIDAGGQSGQREPPTPA